MAAFRNQPSRPYLYRGGLHRSQGAGFLRSSGNLKARLEKIAAVLVSQIGPYPHAKLMVGGAIYEQARKPARAECPHCKFKISMLRQYLDVGPPICPKDMVPMERRGDWKTG